MRTPHFFLCILLILPLHAALAQTDSESGGDQAAASRSFTAGRFALEIDGQSAGFIKSVNGGLIKGEVATQDLGPQDVSKKNIATISHEPLTFEVGIGMGQGLTEWIRASFNREFTPRTGVFIAADFDYKVRSALEFFEALITEVTFPAMDAASKKPGVFKIQVQPEFSEFIVTPDIIVLPPVSDENKAKPWLSSNFVFELGGMPTSRVSKIDAFSWKMSVEKLVIGDSRIPNVIPTSVELGELKVSIGTRDLGPWQEWHKSFVIDGMSTDAEELTGSITYLAPDLKTELGRIELFNVGIFALDVYGESTAKPGVNKEDISHFTVDLYVEDIKFLIR